MIKKENRGGKRPGAGRKPKNGVGTEFTGLSIEKATKIYFTSIKPNELTNSQFLSVIMNDYLTKLK